MVQQYCAPHTASCFWVTLSLIKGREWCCYRKTAILPYHINYRQGFEEGVEKDKSIMVCICVWKCHNKPLILYAN